MNIMKTWRLSHIERSAHKRLTSANEQVSLCEAAYEAAKASHGPRSHCATAWWHKLSAARTEQLKAENELSHLR